MPAEGDFKLLQQSARFPHEAGRLASLHLVPNRLVGCILAFWVGLCMGVCVFVGYRFGVFLTVVLCFTDLGMAHVVAVG